MVDGKEADQKIDAQRCSYCGTCLYFCPIYKKMPHDTIAPRGKVTLISEYQKGNLEPSDYFEHICSMCILCKRCAEFCPSGISISDLVLDMRSELVERKGFSEHQGFFQRIVSAPRSAYTTVRRKLFSFFWTLMIRYRLFYDMSLKTAYVLQNILPRKKKMITWAPYPLHGWTHKRYMQPVAKHSFNKRWKRLFQNEQG